MSSICGVSDTTSQIEDAGGDRRLPVHCQETPAPVGLLGGRVPRDQEEDGVTGTPSTLVRSARQISRS
jgi:hypothetical protein